MPAKNHVDYSSPFYGGLKPNDDAAWRCLRDQGGWWSGAELAVELPDLGNNYACASRLRRLQQSGYLVRRPGRTKSDPDRYGVTAQCFPIPGETLTPSNHATTETPAHPFSNPEPMQ